MRCILVVMQTALRLLLLTVCAGHGCATSLPNPTESAINAQSRVAARVCGGLAVGGERTEHELLVVDRGTGKFLAVGIVADAGNPELAKCATSVLEGVQIPSTRRGLGRIEVSLDWEVHATSATSTGAASASNAAPVPAPGRATRAAPVMDLPEP